LKLKRDKYDKATSDLIRAIANWSCERCGSYFPEGHRQGLHCSHYYGRSRSSTRYDLENTDSLCYGCHQLFGSDDREAYRVFKIKKLGQKRFDLLMLRANKVKKWTIFEKDLMLKLYKEDIKTLQTENQ